MPSFYPSISSENSDDYCRISGRHRSSSCTSSSSSIGTNIENWLQQNCPATQKQQLQIFGSADTLLDIMMRYAPCIRDLSRDTREVALSSSSSQQTVASSSLSERRQPATLCWSEAAERPRSNEHASFLQRPDQLGHSLHAEMTTDYSKYTISNFAPARYCTSKLAYTYRARIWQT